eukprot:2400684-Amphidinium_carterae.1
MPLRVQVVSGEPVKLETLQLGHVAGDGNCTWRALCKACQLPYSWARLKKKALKGQGAMFKHLLPRGVWAGSEAYMMTAAMLGRKICVHTPQQTTIFLPQDALDIPAAMVCVTNNHASPICGGAEPVQGLSSVGPMTFENDNLTAGSVCAYVPTPSTSTPQVMGCKMSDPRCVALHDFGAGLAGRLLFSSPQQLASGLGWVFFPKDTLCKTHLGLVETAQSMLDLVDAGSFPWLQVRGPTSVLTTRVMVHEFQCGKATGTPPRYVFVPKDISLQQLRLLLAESCAFAPSWIEVTRDGLNVSMNLTVSNATFRECRLSLSRTVMNLHGCLKGRKGAPTAVFGLRAFGARGLTNRTLMHQDEVREINRALKQVLPGCVWTSLAIIRAADIETHQDTMNKPGLTSHVWELLRQDTRMLCENARGMVHAWHDNDTGRDIKGTWRNISTHPCCFDATLAHQVFTKCTWMISAYSVAVQVNPRDRLALMDLGFPLDPLLAGGTPLAQPMFSDDMCVCKDEMSGTDLHTEGSCDSSTSIAFSDCVRRESSVQMNVSGCVHEMREDTHNDFCPELWLQLCLKLSADQHWGLTENWALRDAFQDPSQISPTLPFEPLEAGADSEQLGKACQRAKNLKMGLNMKQIRALLLLDNKLTERVLQQPSTLQGRVAIWNMLVAAARRLNMQVDDSTPPTEANEAPPHEPASGRGRSNGRALSSSKGNRSTEGAGKPHVGKARGRSAPPPATDTRSGEQPPPPVP